VITDLETIATEIVDAAVKLHMRLGPGLLEKVYEKMLANDLRQRGLSVERQKTIPFEFEGEKFDKGLTVDLLVNGLVVVEIKSAQRLARVDSKQVLTHLRLLDLRIGLLINFGEFRLKDGLRRIVNGYEPSPSSPLRVNRPRDVED
jgi:GxxExxY protein